MQEITVHTPDDLQLVAKELLSTLPEEKSAHEAVVLALHGDLGAGKTTLVQTLAGMLGVTEPVTSPTFVIMKQYELGKEGVFDLLVHVDAYRLESIEELEPLQFESLLTLPRTLVCIEWAERIQEQLPTHTVHCHLKAVEGEVRTATINHES